MRRQTRLIVVLFSLWSLLVSTAALAGYHCPAQEKARQIAEMVDSGAPCAETMSRAMDDEQPSLCHAECQVAGQASAAVHPPLLVSWVELGVVLVLPGDDRLASLGSFSAAEPPPPRTGPSMAVRNCCFRI